MNKIGMILALLTLLFVAAAAVLMGNTDVSSPALAANELSQGAPGAATSQIIFNQIMGYLLGTLVAGVVAGVGAIVFRMLSDWYESRQSGNGAWESGPNAGFRRKGQRQQPAMSKDELFQLALLNAMTQGQAQRYMPQITTQHEDEKYEDF